MLSICIQAEGAASPIALGGKAGHVQEQVDMTVHAVPQCWTWGPPWSPSCPCPTQSMSVFATSRNTTRHKSMLGGGAPEGREHRMFDSSLHTIEQSMGS